MTVVRESAEDGVIWLKCPHCQGILPHMPETSDESSGGEATETETVADPLDGIDVEAARPYEPSQTYEEGDVIHHRGWNDYGVVIGKDVLPGNRHMIVVRFAENGQVQLIEGAA